MSLFHNTNRLLFLVPNNLQKNKELELIKKSSLKYQYILELTHLPFPEIYIINNKLTKILIHVKKKKKNKYCKV